MKKTNFYSACAILALLTACSARIEPKSATPSPSPQPGTGDASKVEKVVAVKDVSKTVNPELKLLYKQLVISVEGFGFRHYAIAPQSDNAFEITVFTLDGAEREKLSLNAIDGKAYLAMADLFSGKLDLANDAGDKKDISTQNSTIITRIDDKKSVVTSDPLALEGDAIQSALRAIYAYVDMRLTETRPETRATPQTCNHLNLAGNWTSDLVIQSDVYTLLSSLKNDATSANGDVTYSGKELISKNGADAANERNVKIIYHPGSCVLEKAVDQAIDKDAKIYKIIFVGTTARQMVKMVPCKDISCNEVNSNPVYTDMILLKRVK